MSTLLIGASGLAREVIATDTAVDVAGIVDDDPALRGTLVAGVPVVGGIDAVAERDESLLVCVGSGSARRSIVERLSRLGVGAERYETAVHPSVVVGRGARVGSGAILLPGVTITADAHLGGHVVVMPHTTITHDDVLEDFVTCASGVSLAGSVRVGEAAYVGMNASVRQGVVVGAGSTIGMGAVVLRDVPENEVWAGVPAAPVGKRS